MTHPIWIRPEDSFAASEGWCLSHGAPGTIEIQRLDDPKFLCCEKDINQAFFDSDEDATQYVARRAAQGSDMHLRALLIVTAGLTAHEFFQMAPDIDPQPNNVSPARGYFEDEHNYY